MNWLICTIRGSRKIFLMKESNATISTMRQLENGHMNNSYLFLLKACHPSHARCRKFHLARNSPSYIMLKYCRGQGPVQKNSTIKYLNLHLAYSFRFFFLYKPIQSNPPLLLSSAIIIITKNIKHVLYPPFIRACLSC